MYLEKIKNNLKNIIQCIQKNNISKIVSENNYFKKYLILLKIFVKNLIYEKQNEIYIHKIIISIKFFIHKIF